jgi:hypothetical protein
VKQLVYIKWNDACEADTYDEVHMNQCIQETAGFLVKVENNNYYLARDYNTINEESNNQRFEKVIRIPESYIIEKRFYDTTSS